MNDDNGLYRYNINAPLNYNNQIEIERDEYYQDLIDHGSANNIKHEIATIKDTKLNTLPTLFRLAIRTGNIEKINLFFDSGIDIQPFLHTAVLTNKADIVALFLENGANIDKVNEEGYSPLDTAIVHSCMNSFTILVERGANVNIENNAGNTPLISAIIHNNTDILKILLDNPKLDINYQNKDGNTALIAALDLRNIEVALLLIKHGASLSIPNAEGDTPQKIIETFEGFPKERLEEALQEAAWKRRRAVVMSRAIMRKPARRTRRRRRIQRSRRRRN